MTRLCKISSSFISLSFSDSVSLETGIFVHLDTIPAISSSVTTCFSPVLTACFPASSFNASISALISSACCLYSSALIKSSTSLAFCFFSSTSSRELVSLSISGEAKLFFTFNLDAASSIRSIALSGKNLSIMYRTDRETALTIALSVIFTPWNFSKLGLIPFKIFMQSDSLGSRTDTG